MEKQPSQGKTTALAGIGATQLVTLLLYTVHRFGIDDMTPEVAGAIIGVSMAIGGGIAHEVQRWRERKEAKNEKPNGDFGGAPAPEPVAQ